MSQSFTLTSTSVQPNQRIPEKFVFNGMGCSGENISPELKWSGAPSETKSFAVTVFDPDAPTGTGWWHWAVVNIPGNVNELPEGASSKGKLPGGALEIETDFKQKNYGGPCPPKGHGSHRYVFTVYALKEEKLDWTPKHTSESLRAFLEKNSLGKATLTSNYQRQ